MMTTSENEQISPAAKLGLQSGQVVQEFGHADDADEELRDAIVAVTGNELVDENYEDVADVVLQWFRDQDGDLADQLANALGSLADGGCIWLLTPKAGQEGEVEPSDIGEAVPTVGLSRTTSISAGPQWRATRLVSPKASRSR
ncbi:DUF3052 domain-containing protein [Streptomyces sp. NPDC000151]|uniref:DUF3052 domain-containing protein n=1 Tax=Streptomyces sp. NPDC000151 TaxID=3154244 RepID=UPI003322E7D2